MKKSALISKSLASLGVFALAGCASIVSKSEYPVAIDSKPSGAEFTVTNRDGVVVHRGETPETITLPAGAGFFQSQRYTIELEHEGCKARTAVLDTSMDGWYIGNIVFGGLIGLLIVDPATGAMWKLPESVKYELKPEKKNSSARTAARHESSAAK